MADRHRAGHIGGDVPQKLVDELDVVVERLGLVKKRVLAAALAAFVAADTQTQMRMYQAVYHAYYAPAPPAARGAAAPAEKAVACRRARPPRRRGGKGANAS